ncbi:MAG: aminodeoxychorismate synthase component I [Lacisediminihabitans sp.]
MRRRVLRHLLSDWIDPAAAFAALYARSEQMFWLDSGVDAATGLSYLGESARAVTASVEAGTLSFGPAGRSVPGSTVSGDILDFLGAEQAAGVEIEVDTGGFQLGWVGWLGYELRARTMGSPSGGQSRQTRRSRYPDAAWLEATRALEFDHAARTVTLLALGEDWSGELGMWRDAVTASLAGSANRPGGVGVPGAQPALPPEPARSALANWRYSDDEYLAMIRACQDAIAAGDAYQLCLTTEATVEVHPDPVATYLALRAASPTHHGGLIRVGECALLSSSPEQFLSVSPGGTIESRPIKGTRRRGATPEEDARLRVELETSDKERAENLMIVDLMRNDIARVSAVGSVTVPSLLAVESYAQVHQLVSTVRGQLADGLRPVDAVIACFPAGSMTGAPKSSATEILDRLEQRPRGIYSGAFGYFGRDGRIDLAMVIRSIVLDDRGATVGAGGGITALSVPEDELEEVRLKAAALLAVLGAR